MPVKFKKKKKDKKTADRPAPAPVLSYGVEDDEDAVEFVVKKKKRKKSSTEDLLQSRKNARAKQKLREEGLEPPTIAKKPPAVAHTNYLTASSGAYTKESLQALRGNAINLKSVPKSRSPSPDRTSTNQPGGQLLHSSEVSGRLGRLHDDERRMVEAARDKRMRLRAGGIGDNYISLRSQREGLGASVTVMGREYALGRSDEHGSLMTDHADDDVEDYIQGTSNRIMFGEGVDKRRQAIGSLLKSAPGGKKPSKPSKNQKQTEKKSSRVAGRGINSILADGGMLTDEHGNVVQSTSMVVEDEDLLEEDPGSPTQNGVEEDEAMSSMLDSMIRSGGGSLKPSRHDRHKRSRQAKAKQQQRAGMSNTGAATLGNTLSFGEAPPVVSLEAIKKTLKDAASRLTSDVARAQRALEGVRTEMDLATKQARDADVKTEELNRQYLFFQGTRDKLTFMVDCLAEKSSMVTEAWVELQDLLASHKNHYKETENVHLQDQVNDGWGAPLPATDVELDEFGRDVNYTTAAGAEHRSTLRLTRREKRTEELPDGWSSDDDEDGVRYEEPAEGARISERRSALLEDAALIFEDVTDEFANFDTIQEQLGYWKMHYRSSYEDAYIAMSFPSVLAPYIRLALLHWHPLKVPELSSMAWYDKLYDYGMCENMAEDDLDGTLIPRLVDKLVVPVVGTYLRTVWQVYSTRAQSNAVQVVKEVQAHLVQDATNQLTLVNIVCERFAEEVNAHVRWPCLPTPHTPMPTTPAANAEEEVLRSERREDFCRQRWWKACKLMANMCIWIQAFDEEGSMNGPLASLSVSHMQDALFPFLQNIVERVCLTATSETTAPSSVENTARDAEEKVIAAMCTQLARILGPLAQTETKDTRPSLFSPFASLSLSMQQYGQVYDTQYAQVATSGLSLQTLFSQQQMERSLALNKVRISLLHLSTQRN
jgi:hypothetical protein